MRHALGLDGQSQGSATPDHPAPQGSDRLSLHRPPRRFVKDGEIPVTVVRRTHPTDAMPNVGPAAQNQLEAARQTIRSQAVAIERAERGLNDAQNQIRDLRTKLAHERLAKDEAFQAVRRLETERDEALGSLQAMRGDLAVERVGREKLEQELRKVHEARQAAEAGIAAPRRRGRPPKIRVAPEVELVAAPDMGAVDVPRLDVPALDVIEAAEPVAPPRKRGRPRKVVAAVQEPPAPPRPRGRPRKVAVAMQAELGLAIEQAPRRRGRPAKVHAPKPVKWWVKGWKSAAE